MRDVLNGKRRCKLCWENEATVRDRENPTEKMKTVCGECHTQRIKRDMAWILRYNRARGIC